MIRRRLACCVVLVLGLGISSCSSSEGSDGGVAGDEGAGGAGDLGEGGLEEDGGTDGMVEEADKEEEPTVPQPITFSDENLEQCVRTALQIPAEDLYPDALTDLLFLECQDMGIQSIGGLEYAVSLVDLSLWENELVEVGPLAGLKNLRYLQLGGNRIEDLTPLSSLSSVQRLGLSINEVGSLQPLAALTSLEWLNLDRNAIQESELVHLAGLTNLRWLTIEHNGIQDVSALEPVVEAGCELYDHHRSLDLETGPTIGVPTRAAFSADPTRLSLRVDTKGQISMIYDLAGQSVKARQIHGSLSTRADRIVSNLGGQSIEVGRVRAGNPVLCQDEYAGVCNLLVGIKWPEAGPQLPQTGTEPIVTVVVEMLNPPRTQVRSGMAWAAMDEDLVPFVFASPNQFDAGSCLFMANTGAMEVLMNQHTPSEQINYDGDTDLSERFLMSAYGHIPTSTTPYLLTDVIYTYEALGGSLLSRDYHFCAGYVAETANGSIQPAEPGEEGAYLSCSYNWFDMMPAEWKSMLVSTPPAERTLIFVDPKRDNNSRWRVGLFDDDAVERIKHELRTKNAPVVVVYNHYLYWHANIVVGYDDTVATNGCPMVEDSIDYFEEKGASSYAQAIRAHMEKHGGCSDHGVFYVRDSIYEGGADEPAYDYSTDQVALQKEKYSRRIVKLDYNWAKYLGNHAYTVHRK